MLDVPYHPYLDEYIYDILTVGICNRFYDFFALHISRPRSNYDVRLYSTAINSIQLNNGIGMSAL